MWSRDDDAGLLLSLATGWVIWAAGPLRARPQARAGKAPRRCSMGTMTLSLSGAELQYLADHHYAAMITLRAHDSPHVAQVDVGLIVTFQSFMVLSTFHVRFGGKSALACIFLGNLTEFERNIVSFLRVLCPV
jgi:hypothetical protein